MNVEILAVGTELLMGQISNTNAQYISRKLPEAGVNVYYHSVVGDNARRLTASLELAYSRCDTVITTGGLGPTEDDLTKETVSRFFGRKLVLHEKSLDMIRSFFEKRGRIMPDNVRKQAYMPEDCTILDNRKGTAPGCIIEAGDRTMIMLPGPPSEMIPMFDEEVMPYLKNRSDRRIASRFVKIVGMGESMVEEKLKDLIDSQDNPTLATYVKDGEVILRITAASDKEEDASQLLDPVLHEVENRLGRLIYDTDGRSIEEVIIEMLRKVGKKVAFAESCTGGMLGTALTDVPGVSDIFAGSVVCYENRIKTTVLGVKSQTLERFGAVSSETAAEMAKGIRKLMGTDYGVAVTGIAGPSGGTATKPVGRVYIAIANEEETVSERYDLTGDRARIRNLARLCAFDQLRRILMKTAGGKEKGINEK